jgi:mannosylglycerate hydrolase
MVKAFVVSHTHWDREWYATRESSRVMLVSLVDRLLDLLEGEPRFAAFMLDGQAIVLEDYCEVRPGNRARLERLVRDGRVLVGPWYVLPDEFLASGEAHVRNFLLGSRICRGFGGGMAVGYLPDSFGHPSQMPQLLIGLGMHEIVFWRGLGPDVTETELLWEGRDGTVIFGVNLPLSYGVAACLPEDPDAFAERLGTKIEALAPLTRTGCVLLMQGVDHVAASPSLVGNLAAARGRLPGVELVHATLSDYLAAVRAAGVEFQRTAGELRSGCRAYLLGGTISTRMPLKQESHRASILLERHLETLAATAWVRGRLPYPADELRHAWKLLLENLPHDSICGCSVDAVHEEMTGRSRSLADFCEALLARCAEALGGPRADDDGGGLLLVLNPLAVERTDVVHATIRRSVRLLRKVDYARGGLDEREPGDAGPDPAGIVVIAPDGSEMTGSLGPWVERDVMKLSEDTQPEMYRVREAPVMFVASRVPPLGYAVFAYRFSAAAAASSRAPAWLENEFLAARFDAATGTLTVRDKRSGRTFAGLAAFEDTLDAGDEYTYSAPATDFVATLDPASAAFTAGPDDGSRRMEGALRLPARLAGDRQSRSAETTVVPVAVTISVHPGVPRVDVRVEVDNRAEDHRLRLVFPTGLAVAAASSEGVFSVDDRPLTPDDPSAYAGWVEPPSTHPQKSFVSVSDGTAGLTVANRGLPEYEVFDRGGAVIAVTLLRCVGWLSRPDLRARKGNGGWTIPTPGAQCPGRHAFDLSVIPHTGTWDTGGGALAARGFETPLRAFACGGGGGAGVARAGERFSLVGVDRPEIVVTAAKGSERGGSLVLRCFNSSDRTVSARFTPGFPVERAFETNLAEDRGTAIETGGGRFELAFDPWKIRTVELVPRLPPGVKS